MIFLIAFILLWAVGLYLMHAAVRHIPEANPGLWIFLIGAVLLAVASGGVGGTIAGIMNGTL